MSFSRARGFVFVLLIIAANAFLLGGIILAQDEPPHWTYEGEEGPAHWGELSDAYELCSAGESQSPIDILDPASEALTDIQFSYLPGALTIKNNGHTIQVDYEPGSTITVEGTEYALVQFHFHHPSEHTVDGILYPMELHLVHADADGNLAVVGVLIKEGMDDNPAFAPVFDNLPVEQSDPMAIDGVTVSAADLLPADHLFYTYGGSLTTPPCSENVRWLVLTTPVTLSPAQISRFTDIFELNARPTQPLHDREVTADSAADN